MPPEGSSPARKFDSAEKRGGTENLLDPELRQALLGLHPKLRAFAISLCGDIEQADDLVQETYLKAWDHLASFQKGTNLRAWLFTILRNTFFSQTRKEKREPRMSEEKYEAAIAKLIAPENPERHMDMVAFHKALVVLPPDQREALNLIGGIGLSYEEAAEIQECAVGTIKSRVSRARSTLLGKLGIAKPLVQDPAADTEDIALGQSVFGF